MKDEQEPTEALTEKQDPGLTDSELDLIHGGRLRARAGEGAGNAGTRPALPQETPFAPPTEPIPPPPPMPL